MSRPIQVGDVIEVDEADYCYGIGPLILRLTDEPKRIINDREWIHVEGMELRRSGVEVQQRVVVVRARAVRRFKP